MNAEDKAITDAQLAQMFTGDIPYGVDVMFYLDENISQEIAESLQARGVLVTDVYAEGQVSERVDTLVLARAREMGCILVSADRDFEEICQRITGIGGLSHAGVIMVSGSLLHSSEALTARLARLTEKFEGFPDWLRNQVYHP
jgi:hypothetical protein